MGVGLYLAKIRERDIMIKPWKELTAFTITSFIVTSSSWQVAGLSRRAENPTNKQQKR